MEKEQEKRCKDTLPENPLNCGIHRQSAKAVLDYMISRLRRKADELEIIKKMLPVEPTAEQDEALRSLLNNIPRMW